MFKQNPDLFFPQAQELENAKALLAIAKSNKIKNREDKNYIKSLEKEIADLTANFKTMEKNIMVFGGLKEIFPSGIGFELKMTDGTIFSGNLKSNYLIDTEEIIFNNYGGYLPDVWNVFGIVDYKVDKTAMDENSSHNISKIFELPGQIKEFFTDSDISGTIVPIIIYRELVL